LQLIKPMNGRPWARLPISSQDEKSRWSGG
jgi:hypothetical protein